MQNNDKKYFIPVNGNPIEVSEEVYRAYYQPIWNTRYAPMFFVPSCAIFALMILFSSSETKKSI